MTEKISDFLRHFFLCLLSQIRFRLLKNDKLLKRYKVFDVFTFCLLIKLFVDYFCTEILSTKTRKEE